MGMDVCPSSIYQGESMKKPITVRQINTACQAYAVGGSGCPVYAEAKDGSSGKRRIIRAKTEQGKLLVESINGPWFEPTSISVGSDTFLLEKRADA
jgi:hypothetical protein